MTGRLCGSNEIYGSDHITTFLPAKSDTIAFGFAGGLEINQQDGITGAMQETRALDHTQSIGANARQKQDCAATISTWAPPAADTSTRIACKLYRLGVQVARS